MKTPDHWVSDLFEVMNAFDRADLEYHRADVAAIVNAIQEDAVTLAVAHDEARLLAMLDEDRNDVLYLLADLCEEQGRVETAKGWRWLANARKWPESNGDGWKWWPGTSESYSLPDRLFYAAVSSRSVSYPNTVLAFLVVVDAIARGDWTL